jgi:hypothetical protein
LTGTINEHRRTGGDTEPVIHLDDALELLAVSDRRCHHQAEVFGHDAKGVDLPLRRGASLTEAVKESLAARIIGEDGLAAVSAVHHVTDGTRICQAQPASHADRGLGKDAIGK